MISHSSPPVMANHAVYRLISLLVVQAILFNLIAAQKPSKNCLDCLIKNHIYNYEQRSDFALLWNSELQESINDTCRQNMTCLPQALEQFLEKNIVDCSGDSIIDCIDYALILQFGQNCRSQRGNIFRFWAHSTFSPCFQADSVPPLIEPELTTTIDMISSKVIDPECLRCICSASTDCSTENATCTGNRCGPYMISRNQYEKAEQPGESFSSCASSKNCSELVLQRFMAKNSRDCNNDGIINCEDFAAFHEFGSNCHDNRLRSTNFWRHFEYCTIMADDVRREPNPWDNSGIRSNYSADSVPPLVVAPILFNSVPILTTTLDSGINQIISIDYNCFNCIHQASSAYNDSSIYSGELHGCGPFMISRMYFDRVNGLDENINYENCCRNRECSEKVVQAYVESNPFDCNRDGYIDCLDYAIIHKLGAEKCKLLENQENFMESLYWEYFQTCYGFD